jgi:hypothetical protein
MGIEALTRDDAGNDVTPRSSDDWRGWVSATATRNYMMKNTLADWLDLYGEKAGFTRDTAMPGHDRRTDFTLFIFRQGNAFETAVVRHVETLVPMVSIARGPSAARNLRRAEETFEAMRAGEQLIYQGVLWDAENRTYGAPDFLIRSDVLLSLFPSTITDEEARRPAPDIGADSWHYIVVDVKFTTLDLRSGGAMGDGGSSPAYKAQAFVYNRALGRLQGFAPSESYLLGRNWRQQQGKETLRGTGSMERLGAVRLESTLGGRPRAARVVEAAGWVRRVRSEGGDWRVLPRPSAPELWPSNGGSSGFPWGTTHARITAELSDLTMLWQVGDDKRNRAHAQGIYSWRDPRCTAEALEVTGDHNRATLQAILDVNQSEDGPAVTPPRVSAAEDQWRAPPPLEFYVDFETVSDLADDFSTIPAKGGRPLIFMIGCGHMEGGEWTFRCFIAEDLSEAAEERVIDGWLEHMEDVKRRMGVTDDVRVLHWSQAEVSEMETSYRSAAARHPTRTWPPVQWFDFLGQVVRAEPVVVRGAFGFGLKAVAKALHGQGLIETRWDDGPMDGLGAMVGAWWCAEEAQTAGIALADVPLMGEIARYNEVDCRVVMEIVRYLREHH